MNNQHPLNDEIILSIADEALHLPGYQDDLRAAADWQLEQVLKWLKTKVDERTLYELKKAMRP